VSTISVKTQFSAGHRILGLTGPGAKCANIHGHSFVVIWTFNQNAGDLTLEFGQVKATLRDMIKNLFDHGFIVDKADGFRDYLRAGKLKLYALNGPPTTEMIAQEIAFLTMKAMPKAPLHSVELQEGPENSATWSRSPSLGIGVELKDHGGKTVAVVNETGLYDVSDK